jgi:hypothetical protein
VKKTLYIVPSLLAAAWGNKRSGGRAYNCHDLDDRDRAMRAHFYQESATEIKAALPQGRSPANGL